MLAWGYYKSLFNEFGFDIVIGLTVFLSIHLYKKYKLHQENHKLVRQEQVETFINVFSNKSSNNKFIVEQVFENKFGSSLSYREIDYFLQFSNPTELISNYIRSRSYFSFPENKNSPEIKSRYTKRLVKIAIPIKDLGGYFIFSALGLACILYSYQIMAIYGPTSFVASCAFGVYLVFVALLFLQQNMNYNAALMVTRFVNYKDIKSCRWVY